MRMFFKSSSLIRDVVLSILFFGILPPTQVALQAQPTDTPTTAFADQLEVRLVHVDVQVLRRGKPVTDLGVEDFVLLEDGEPVEIAVFSPPDEAVTPQPELVENTTPGTADPVTDEAEIGTVAVFVDDIGLPPGQRKRALRTIEALAESSRELIVLRHFKRGRLTLQLPSNAAVEPKDLKGMSPAAAAREQRTTVFAMREIQSALEFSNCINARGQLLSIADSYAATAFASTEMRSQLLGDAIEYLGAIPGRKLLVVLSGPIEIQPGGSVVHVLQELCPDLQSELSSRLLSVQNVANRLHRVAGLANAHRVTMITVDPQGISAPAGSSALLNAPRFAGNAGTQMAMDSNRRSALTQLATETGGTAIFNANNPVKPILSSLEEADAVYTLAFYPKHERTGKRHVLKVRLAGDAKRRTRLNYRRSYMDRTQPQEWADSLRTVARAAELRPDASLPNPLGARMAVTRTKDGLMIGLGLDGDAVATLRTLSTQSERRFRLWLYVVDPQGRETTAREGFLSGPSQPGLWQAHIGLQLPDGDWTVAAGLRDELTGEISMLRQRVL